MPLVINPASLACRAERLAWAASGPDWPVIRPPCLSQGMGPDSNTGEEVALVVHHKLAWYDILD
jgi:hypothetical protein